MIVPELKTVGAVTMSVVFAGFLGNFYIEKRKCDQAKSLPYLRESFNLLRNDIEAIVFLGQPIKSLGFKGNDSKNCIGETKAKFFIDVAGPNGKGTINVWAVKNETNMWDIKRLELYLKSMPDRKILVKDGNVDDIELSVSES